MGRIFPEVAFEIYFRIILVGKFEFHDLFEKLLNHQLETFEKNLMRL